MEQILGVETLKKVNLVPGDVLLVELAPMTTIEHLDELKPVFKEVFPDNEVVFYGDGMKLSVAKTAPDKLEDAEIKDTV